MSDIFREVDEEVRQDRALALWQKYQFFIIGLALLIVAIVGAWRFVASQRQAAAEAANAQFQKAVDLSRDGKTAEAEAAFDAVAHGPAPGYAKLARLLQIAELAHHDRAAAVKAYDAFAANSTLDPLVRDDVRLRAAALRLDEADRAEIENRLGSLAAVGEPFRASARELLALAAIRAGDMEAAGRWLDQIVTDTQAPAELKQRAEAFMSVVRADRAPPK